MPLTIEKLIINSCMLIYLKLYKRPGHMSTYHSAFFIKSLLHAMLQLWYKTVLLQNCVQYDTACHNFRDGHKNAINFSHRQQYCTQHCTACKVSHFKVALLCKKTIKCHVLQKCACLAVLLT